ncbi:hypothetical protein ACRRTK_005300 [Alexandromys fortis]
MFRSFEPYRTFSWSYIVCCYLILVRLPLVASEFCRYVCLGSVWTVLQLIVTVVFPHDVATGELTVHSSQVSQYPSPVLHTGIPCYLLHHDMQSGVSCPHVSVSHGRSWSVRLIVTQNFSPLTSVVSEITDVLKHYRVPFPDEI